MNLAGFLIPPHLGVDLVEGAGLLVGQEGGVVMKERLSKKGVELWINGGPKECFHITAKIKIRPFNETKSHKKIIFPSRFS